MTASRKRFTQEFKDDLCRKVVNTSKPIKDVTTAYGVGAETLRNCHEGRQRRQATRPLVLSRTNPGAEPHE
jgi:transposase-like protein